MPKVPPKKQKPAGFHPYLPSPAPTPKPGATAAAASDAAHFPAATSAHGKRARTVEMSAHSGELSVFNHTGAVRKRVRDLGSGASISAEEFRDPPQPSAEFASGNRGRHEISATAERSALAGNPVAAAVGATARTNTGLSFLSGPGGEVVAHSGLMTAGMSTSGQADAHKPFHAFPATLAAQTDPHVAAAMSVQTALAGMAKPRDIRASAKLTSATWVGGTGPMEAPDTSRGHDDGYDTDTNRGQAVRRVSVAREHAKDVLTLLRTASPAAAAATSPPSPRMSRGGMGTPGPRGPMTLPDVSGKSPEDAAAEFGNFAFAGWQSLKPK